MTAIREQELSLVTTLSEDGNTSSPKDYPQGWKMLGLID